MHYLKKIQKSGDNLVTRNILRVVNGVINREIVIYYFEKKGQIVLHVYARKPAAKYWESNILINLFGRQS